MWETILRILSASTDRLLHEIREQNREILVRLVAVRTAIEVLNKRGIIMTDAIQDLDEKQTALEGKVDESVETLKGLAQTVVDLKGLIGNSQALEAAVTHAAVRAQKMLDKLTAAEDSADDQLPPVSP